MEPGYRLTVEEPDGTFTRTTFLFYEPDEIQEIVDATIALAPTTGIRYLSLVWRDHTGETTIQSWIPDD